LIELDEIPLSGVVVRLIGCVEFDGATRPYEPNGGDVPAIGFGLIRHLDRPLSLGYWGLTYFLVPGLMAGIAASQLGISSSA